MATEQAEIKSTEAPEIRVSGFSGPDQPELEDYSRCIRCGLCLNQCPTYRELGVEMDSPRGRIYQMVQVAEGRLPLGESFVQHIDKCLDCRACETACPSGVEYGKLVEGARAQIHQHYRRPLAERLLRDVAFRHLLPKPKNLRIAAALMWFYQSSGLQEMVRRGGLLDSFPRLSRIDPLAPTIESPSFFSEIGKVFPARGKRRARVAFHAGCITNVAFARMQEATVRVLQANGCEVLVPAGQICCGALHVHGGRTEEARALARQNIDRFLHEPAEVILTNAAGCGSTLKEYGYLLRNDPSWKERAETFAGRMKDVTEFLAEIGLTQPMREVPKTVTYQDSCHLSHGQRVRRQPRQLLEAVPGLQLVEMPYSDLCCGSAGIYNITETGIAMQLLRNKMDAVNGTGADTIATANPGCMLQLRAGVKLDGRGQHVAHVVELLDQARAEE